MIEIVDDFLPKDKFEKIKDTIFDTEFNWYWTDNVTGEHDVSHFYFTHVLFNDMGINSPFFEDVGRPFIDMIDYKSMMRIKVNAYPRGETLFEHGYHSDSGYDHRGALFCINTCDGYTRFQTGEKVPSIANRIIYFNPHILHTSTNTTDQSRRVNINFNFF